MNPFNEIIFKWDEVKIGIIIHLIQKRQIPINFAIHNKIEEKLSEINPIKTAGEVEKLLLDGRSCGLTLWCIT